VNQNPKLIVYKAIFVSFTIVATTVLFGYLVGQCLKILYGPSSQLIYQWLQYTGIAILLWATLAKQGWNIQTWNGTTVAEKIDKWVFWSLYLLGSFILVLSVAWPAQ
jgi:hypothetical protein